MSAVLCQEDLHYAGLLQAPAACLSLLLCLHHLHVLECVSVPQQPLLAWPGPQQVLPNPEVWACQSQSVVTGHSCWPWAFI